MINKEKLSENQIKTGYELLKIGSKWTYVRIDLGGKWP